MKILLILMLIIFNSCSLFKPKLLNRNLSTAAKSVCLSADGRGRLTFLKRKYVFSYESYLDEAQANWLLALSFPLHAQETFKIDWSKNDKIELISSIEDKILRENKNINPAMLHAFTENVGSLIKEIIDLRSKKVKTKFNWIVTNKELSAKSKDSRFEANFLNMLNSGYFGLMSLKYKVDGNSPYKLDLIVSNCLKE